MQTTDNNLERGGTGRLAELASAWQEFSLGFTNEARFIFGMVYGVHHEVEMCCVVRQSKKSSRAFRAGVVSAYAGVAAMVPVYFGLG